jgi:hypothetical protein
MCSGWVFSMVSRATLSMCRKDEVLAGPVAGRTMLSRSRTADQKPKVCVISQPRKSEWLFLSRCRSRLRLVVLPNSLIKNRGFMGAGHSLVWNFPPSGWK